MNFVVMMTSLRSIGVYLGLLVPIVPLMILLLIEGVLVNLMVAVTSLLFESINLGLFVTVIPLMILLLI